MYRFIIVTSSTSFIFIHSLSYYYLIAYVALNNAWLGNGLFFSSDKGATWTELAFFIDYYISEVSFSASGQTMAVAGLSGKKTINALYSYDSYI